MPQPQPMTKGTTPSMLGKSSRMSVRLKASAMMRATVAEQFTLVSTPM